MGERRASPYFSATASNSFLISVFSRAALPSVCSSRSRSAAALPARRGSHLFQFRQVRNFSSSMASAWISEMPKRAISTGFGLSSVRMMWITSSMLR
jgi:hypothetical protein